MRKSTVGIGALVCAGAAVLAVYVITRVLPLPAPANTTRGPASWSTASR